MNEQIKTILLSQHIQEDNQNTQQQPVPQSLTKPIQIIDTQIKIQQKTQHKQTQPIKQTTQATKTELIQQAKQKQPNATIQIQKQPAQVIAKDPLTRSSMKVDVSTTNIKNKEKLFQQILQEQNIHEKKQQKKQQKKQEKKQESQSRKLSKQQEIKVEGLSNVAIERPISINIGKDILQMQKQHVIIFKQPQIKIQIKQINEKGFALNKQLFFRIVGFDKHGPIDISRSIQEFQSLRKILLERWPGCFVPSVVLQSDAKTQRLRMQHKCKNLEQFLRKISYFQQIYYKEQIQLFLRSYGINMQQMFTSMPILRAKDVIERFKGGFGEIVEQNSSPVNASTISKFSTALKKIIHHLDNLAKKVLKLAQSYQIYQQSVPKFATFLSHYQNACLSQYTNDPNRTIALHRQQKFNKFNIIREKDNIFYDLYFLIENQSLDASALTDVILAMQMFIIRRDQLQQQSKQTRQQIEEIALGHKNIKLMTSRKSKQQLQTQLQQKQKRLLNEKQIVLQLSGMAQIVLAKLTIPIFKRIKINNYFHIINKWVQIIGDVNMEIYQVWKFLAEESNQQLKKCKN